MANLQMSVIVPDISFYQDNNATPQKVDFVKMKAAGAKGVIIRAGQNTWKDEDFSYNWQAAKAAGLKRGAYWYYDSRNTPLAQADLFVSQFKMDLPEMEAWCDYEELYGGAYGGWRNFAVFVQRVKDLLPTCKIGIYTGYYYFKDHCPDATIEAASLAWFGKFPLWIASYVINPVDVKLPAPWSTALYWQFTAHGDGPKWGAESLNIDLSYFNGSAADFDARYGVVTPPIDPPVVTPISYTLKSVTMAGVPVYGDVTVTADISGVTFVRTITQTPPVVDPPDVPPSGTNLYRVDAAKWRITHNMDKPPDQGPLTQTICHTPKQAYQETPLSTKWQAYVKSWNSAQAWGKIIETAWGPSKGYNGNGLLRYIGLVWPSNASHPNVVKAVMKDGKPEISADGLWLHIESIPMDGSADLTKISPTLTPWLFHKVCDKNGNPVEQNVTCPILGQPWWCLLAILTKV